MTVIESAGITDVGRKRTQNEDALYIDDDLGLYMVADGMGGHRAGEVASQLVLDTIRDYIRRISANEQTVVVEPDDASLSIQANQLLNGIYLSNRAVFDISNSKDAYRGMGSTLSALLFNEQTLIAANVGDSPIYLIHKDNIELLSEPHTVFAEHAHQHPDMADQLGDEFKHMLTRAMGVTSTVKANICEIPFFTDDVLVIASDGLSDLVAAAEILETVRSSESTANACRALVNMANERGGDDNITVVVLKVTKSNQNEHGIKKVVGRLVTRLSGLIK